MMELGNEGAFSINVYSPGNLIAREITINGNVSLDGNLQHRCAATSENLHAAFEELKGMIDNKRKWFSVIKVLMWRRYVCDGDFAGAVAMIRQIMPELELDAKDMSRLNVQTFSKPLERWDASDAPVQGNVFVQYKDIATKGMELIPENKT